MLVRPLTTSVVFNVLAWTPGIAWTGEREGGVRLLLNRPARPADADEKLAGDDIVACSRCSPAERGCSELLRSFGSSILGVWRAAGFESVELGCAMVIAGVAGREHRRCGA